MKSFARTLMAVWLVGAGVVGSPVICIANPVVTTNPAIEIKRGIVRLSDLFVGVPTYIDTDIAQAPATGKQAVYDTNVLTKLADKFGLEWHPQSASEHVVVTALYTRIGEDEIRKAVAQKIKDSGVRGEIEVGFDTKALNITLPADQSPDFTITNFEYDSLTKRFHGEFATQIAGAPYNLPLNGHAIVKQRVPVFAHRIENGSIISADDLDWINVPEERIGDTVVTEADQLVGRELRRTTIAGELLHSNDVMPPRLVTRGGLVTMKIQTTYMTLTAQGKAMQDGTKGDTVRVLNTQSNRMIEGIVDGAGSVVIPTAQKLADAQ